LGKGKLMDIKLFIKHIFTGKDNATFDVGRLLWALGVLVFLGISIYSVAKGNPFNAIDYGAGFGGLLAGGGAGLSLKAKTEPECRREEKIE
jgi:hypothetical protein